MHDRMLISHDEMQDNVFMNGGGEAAASPRTPAAASGIGGRMQALFALSVMGCLAAETFKWIAGAAGHTLRA